MSKAIEVLADWADKARGPLRGTTCEQIATGIERWLSDAGLVIVPATGTNDAALRSHPQAPASGEVLAKYEDLPPAVAEHLSTLEDLICDLDGKTLALSTGEDTFSDEGTIVADDYVAAFNGIAAWCRAALSPSQPAPGALTFTPNPSDPDWSDSAAVISARLASGEGKLREALEPFAKVAKLPQIGGKYCDDYMSITVALMNGNVTQSVMHQVLKVGDFRKADEALSTSLSAIDPGEHVIRATGDRA